MQYGKKETAIDLPRPAALLAVGADNALSKQDIVYAAMRDAILGRLIAAETRLPSTRTLAQRWGVSRGTVEMAYDRLSAEAYVTRLAGSGTRVCAVVPDRYLMAALPNQLGQRALSATTAAGGPATTGETAVQAGRPFVARLADPALFSLPSWSRHITRALRDVSADTLCSADPRGLPQLREQIAAYLRSYRGIVCSADDIVVLTGIRHALDLLARSILRAGDEVCVEDPLLSRRAADFRAGRRRGGSAGGRPGRSRMREIKRAPAGAFGVCHAGPPVAHRGDDVGDAATRIARLGHRQRQLDHRRRLRQ